MSRYDLCANSPAQVVPAQPKEVPGAGVGAKSRFEVADGTKSRFRVTDGTKSRFGVVPKLQGGSGDGGMQVFERHPEL